MQTLTLAVATSDGATVAEHLARASSFVLFPVEAGVAGAPVVRHRETGECGNHKTFVELLAGASVVISGGIGDGALRSLAANGIQSVVSVERPAIADAVAQYLAGTLETTTKTVCLCSH